VECDYESEVDVESVYRNQSGFVGSCA